MVDWPENLNNFEFYNISNTFFPELSYFFRSEQEIVTLVASVSYSVFCSAAGMRHILF